jgi:hypothetical protein
LSIFIGVLTFFRGVFSLFLGVLFPPFAPPNFDEMNSDPETSLFLGDLLNKSPSNVKFRRAAFFCGVRPVKQTKKSFFKSFDNLCHSINLSSTMSDSINYNSFKWGYPRLY